MRRVLLIHNGRRQGTDRRKYLRAINGLDMVEGIERVDGNEESFMEVLRSYAASARALLKTMKDVERGDLADYKIKIHGIKGSSWSVGAHLVGDAAEALEKAAEAGDLAFIRANNAAFIEAAGKCIADIQDMLDKADAQRPKPQKAEPDKETLSKLLSACEKYSMDGVDEAMAEIEKWEYGAGGDLAAWLRENAGEMNFARIAEKLRSLPL